MFKKITSVIVSILIMCAMLAVGLVGVGAEGTATITLDEKTYDVPVGKVFMLETKVECDNPASGGRVVLKFDTEKIELVSVDGNVYETELGEVLSVAGYTYDGKGCSYAFVAVEPDSENILGGSNNTLVRFYMRAKTEGAIGITFDAASYDFSVYTGDGIDSNTPIISGNAVVGNASGYNFVGNVITVLENEDDVKIEDATAAPPTESKEEGENGDTPDQNTTTDNGSVDGETEVPTGVPSNGTQNGDSTTSDGGNGGVNSTVIVIICVIAALAAVAAVMVVRTKKKK